MTTKSLAENRPKKRANPLRPYRKCRACQRTLPLNGNFYRTGRKSSEGTESEFRSTCRDCEYAKQRAASAPPMAVRETLFAQKEDRGLAARRRRFYALSGEALELARLAESPHG